MVELKYGQEKETGQVAISLMPNTWWHGFWILAGFNCIYPLRKTIQWCLSSRSFFLSTDDTVALTDWMAVATFMYFSTFGPCPSKTNSASLNKTKSPCHFLCHESFLFFSCFFLLFLCPFTGPPVTLGLHQ